MFQKLMLTNYLKAAEKLKMALKEVMFELIQLKLIQSVIKKIFILLFVSPKLIKHVSPTQKIELSAKQSFSHPPKSFF